MFCFRFLGATLVAAISLSASTMDATAASRIVRSAVASTTAASRLPVETVIHSFTGGADGGAPEELIADGTGALYGTTTFGGTGCVLPPIPSGCGVVFKLTPPARGQTAWTESILHFFGTTSGDGIEPAFISFDRHGDLYGTAVLGGSPNCNSGYGPAGCGVVFKLTRPVAATGAWTESVLYSFTGIDGDGSNPSAALTFGPSGELYGVTPFGGLGNGFGQGYGTAFKLTPPASGKTAWTETIIHTFSGKKGDGAGPGSALLIDERGNLYGTTDGGSTTANDGTFFKLTPPSWGHVDWTATVLHDFSGPNGNYAGNFITPYRGAIYGTTVGGGTNCPQSGGCGVVFRLTPQGSGNTTWSESVLHSFDGTDGNAPYNGVIIADNALLGTAFFGGSANMGTVFRLTPPAAGGTVWKQTILHTFTGKDGGSPIGILSNRCALYGMTESGGAFNQGTVFELK